MEHFFAVVGATFAGVFFTIGILTIIGIIIAAVDRVDERGK